VERRRLKVDTLREWTTTLLGCSRC